MEESNCERVTYFDQIGATISEATDLEQAIKISKLDYVVEKQRIFTKQELKPTEEHEGGTIFVPVPDVFATVRKDTGEVFGTVKNKYQILQNKDAFDFLDGIIAGGAKFQSAGTYGGASSFITCSTEPIKILDDDIAPYLLFTNSFDGSASVSVMFTPIRVACANTLYRAIREATNRLSVRHSTNMMEKLEASKEILLRNTRYLEALKAESERWAITPFSSASFEALARNLFPIDEDTQKNVIVKNERMIEELLRAYNEDDLQNFNNTAYKAIQAVADFESHKPQLRKSKGSDYLGLRAVMTGMPIFNTVADRLNELA